MVKINADEYFSCIGCLVTSLAFSLSVFIVERYHLSLFAFIRVGFDCRRIKNNPLSTTLSLSARDDQELPSNR